jgi:ankyrin repeat protein
MKGTALRKLAYKGHVPAMRFLLANGANVHEENGDALVQAARKGHAEAVQVLLEHGANVHAFQDGALVQAAHQGHDAVVQVLLAHDADYGAQDNAAYRHGTPEVRALLDVYFERDIQNGLMLGENNLALLKPVK